MILKLELKKSLFSLTTILYIIIFRRSLFDSSWAYITFSINCLFNHTGVVCIDLMCKEGINCSLYVQSGVDSNFTWCIAD